MSIKKEILTNYSIVLFIFIGIALIIFLKIIYLKFRRNYYEDKKNIYFEGKLEAYRGDIYDINRNLLSTSVYRYDIYFDPNTEYLRQWSDSLFRIKVWELAKRLEIFGQHSSDEYFQLIINARKKGMRGVLLLKDITVSQKDTLKHFPIFKYGRNRGGIIAQEKSHRLLLYNNLARRTIGFIRNGKKYGLENVYNGYLSGLDGRALFQRLPGGIIRQLYVIEKAEDGADLISTLDINLQEIVESSLKKRLIELDADYGVAILMEVKTGYIRAIANLGKVSDSVYVENRNYAIGTNYEPGSVMKLASFISVLEKSDISLDTVIDTDNGIWRVASDYSIKDYKKGGFGKITLQHVFEVSSNVGTAKLVYNYFKDNPNEFVQRFSDFGFSKSLDINLEPVPKPIFHIPGDPKWEGLTTILQMSIGYSISVTPLHIITFYNAVANDGKMVKPQFAQAIVKKGKVIKRFEPVYINSSICSEKTIKKIKKMLRGVVENGTGKHYVKSSIVNIAGKSGTAWSYSESTGGYKTETGIIHNTTFVGIFPADKPKYTCLVMIHNPRRKAFGGASAAGVVVKNIAEKIYTIDYDMQTNDKYIVNKQPVKYEIPKVKNGFKKVIVYNLQRFFIPYKDAKSSWVKAYTNDTSVVLKGMKITENKMPDLRGMSLKDALFLASIYRLKVIAEGNGIVVSQSIPPGGKITKNNTTLILTLK